MASNACHPGRTRTLASLPLQSLAGARLPLQIIIHLGRETREVSREFPHNRFRVAPMGEAAVSDAALVSGFVSLLLVSV